MKVELQETKAQLCAEGESRDRCGNCGRYVSPKHPHSAVVITANDDSTGFALYIPLCRMCGHFAKYNVFS